MMASNRRAKSATINRRLAYLRDEFDRIDSTGQSTFAITSEIERLERELASLELSNDLAKSKFDSMRRHVASISAMESSGSKDLVARLLESDLDADDLLDRAESGLKEILSDMIRSRLEDVGFMNVKVGLHLFSEGARAEVTDADGPTDTNAYSRLTVRAGCLNSAARAEAAEVGARVWSVDMTPANLDFETKLLSEFRSRVGRCLSLVGLTVRKYTSEIERDTDKDLIDIESDGPDLYVFGDFVVYEKGSK